MECGWLSEVRSSVDKFFQSAVKGLLAMTSNAAGKKRAIVGFLSFISQPQLQIIKHIRRRVTTFQMLRIPSWADPS